MKLQNKIKVYIASFGLNSIAGSAFMMVDHQDENEVLIAFTLILIASLISGFIGSCRFNDKDLDSFVL